MTVYEEAQKIAKAFNCRVGIFHNGNDSSGRVWEPIAETIGGGFRSAGGQQIHGLVLPDGTIIDGAAAAMKALEG